MNDLLTGLVSVLIATNQPAAVSNLVERTTGLQITVPDANDPVEREYQKLLADDDAAQEEAEKWIQENAKFQTEGAGLPDAVLKLKIRQRMDAVRKSYESFLQRHPKHARARIAYGSFLNDLGEEDNAAKEWEKALELDPKNPAVWNNLANHYGHNGPTAKAIEFYEKAVELNPREPVYYHNFATTVFAFRKDAMARYKISEPEVIDKAMQLYSKALALDPKNFPLATDVARTYYLIQPRRIADAKAAWNHALTLAADDIERQGVYLHLARWEVFATNWPAARGYLNQVTNAMFQETKANVVKTLEKRQTDAIGNLPPATRQP